MSEPCIVPLTKGMFALVDEEDYERVSEHTWFAHQSRPGGAFYAVAHMEIDGKIRTVAMHRFVMNAPKGKQVDHEKGKTLDNRKSQLRFATHQENNQNRFADGTKGTKEISSGRWSATIWLDGKPIYIGTYDTEELAALAYDAKARELFGAFARLNYPDRDERPASIREGLRPTNTSGLLGVTWDKRNECWRAQTTVDGKRKHLGYYDVAEDAGRAFDHFARIAFGDRVRLNFPNDPDVLPQKKSSGRGPKPK